MFRFGSSFAAVDSARGAQVYTGSAGHRDVERFGVVWVCSLDAKLLGGWVVGYTSVGKLEEFPGGALEDAGVGDVFTWIPFGFGVPTYGVLTCEAWNSGLAQS